MKEWCSVCFLSQRQLLTAMVCSITGTFFHSELPATTARQLAEWPQGGNFSDWAVGMPCCRPVTVLCGILVPTARILCWATDFSLVSHWMSWFILWRKVDACDEWTRSSAMSLAAVWRELKIWADKNAQLSGLVQTERKTLDGLQLCKITLCI